MHEPVRERGGIGVGADQGEVESGRRTLGRLLAPEHAREAAHAVAYRGDPAAAQRRRGGRARRHAGGGLELRGERTGIAGSRLDAVALELPHPDPLSDSRRRTTQLQGEHHPAQNRGAQVPGIVHRPQGGNRGLLQQPVHEHFRAAVPGVRRERQAEWLKVRPGAGEQVVHFVEEQQRAAVTAEQALREAKLLEPLAAQGLTALLVRLADAVEGHAKVLGQHFAQLGLAGARRPVEEHVHSCRPRLESASQYLDDMVAVAVDMVEVRPPELARGRGPEQQAVHLEARAARCGDEPVQPTDHVQVTVAVHGDEPRAHERRIVPQTAVDGVGRHTEECRQRQPPEVEGGNAPSGAAEDVVDHRLDDWLGAVAKQELQDVEVGAAEAHRLAERLKPPRGPVVARPSRFRVLLAEGRLDTEQFPLGHPFLGVRVRVVQERSPTPGSKGQAVVPVGYPAGELRRLPVLVVEVRGGVGEVEGDEAFFVGGQHFSLPVNLMESYGQAGLQFWRSTLSTLTLLKRAYGTDASDPVVCLNAAPAPLGLARGAPPVSRRRPALAGTDSTAQPEVPGAGRVIVRRSRRKDTGIPHGGRRQAIRRLWEHRLASGDDGSTLGGSWKVDDGDEALPPQGSGLSAEVVATILPEAVENRRARLTVVQRAFILPE